MKWLLYALIGYCDLWILALLWQGIGRFECALELDRALSPETEETWVSERVSSEDYRSFRDYHQEASVTRIIGDNLVYTVLVESTNLSNPPRTIVCTKPQYHHFSKEYKFNVYEGDLMDRSSRLGNSPWSFFRPVQIFSDVIF